MKLSIPIPYGLLSFLFHAVLTSYIFVAGPEKQKKQSALLSFLTQLLVMLSHDGIVILGLLVREGL